MPKFETVQLLGQRYGLDREGLAALQAMREAASARNRWAVFGLTENATTYMGLEEDAVEQRSQDSVNGHRAESARHLSLVSCAGQAVLPVLDVVARHCAPAYVEVVTTVAGASVGRATRCNLDEYIATTEYAVRRLTHAPDAKVLTTISPALPAPAFRAQVTVVASDIRPEPLRTGVEAVAAAVRTFAPGYEVASWSVKGELVKASVNVTAHGGRLPAYAGNVEIINAAAVLLAERHAASRNE